MVMARAIEHQQVRGLKRKEYDELVKLGVFGRERVELVFGTVVKMSPIDPARRERRFGRVSRRFHRRLRPAPARVSG